MANLVFIPARMESKRFPSKPLAKVVTSSGETTVLKLTYEQAKQSEADVISVITDSLDIVSYCRENNIECEHWNLKAWCGTHRIADYFQHKAKQFIEDYGDIDSVVNLQCDEPLIPPEYLNDLMRLCAVNSLNAWTLGNNYPEITAYNYNRVNVYFDDNLNAIDFRRHTKNNDLETTFLNRSTHIGVYGFPSKFFGSDYYFRPTNRSEKESLEQLAFMQRDLRIKVLPVRFKNISINEPADIEKLEAYYNESGTF